MFALWAAGLAAVIAATRWPFRSVSLFSWDSANFALAIDHIDLAQHRPHPPGYLGYVLAARAFHVIVADSNLALVLWNIVATVAAALVLALLAYACADPDRRGVTAAAAVSIIVSSPLIWFYGEVAEIYPSELLGAALVAYTAWRASKGEDGAIYFCIFALVATAIFKVVTAMLMFPVAVYAWTRVSTLARRRSLSISAVGLIVVVLTFALLQADFFSIAVRVFWSSDWVTWFLRTNIDSFFKVINRNGRNTLMALIAGIGIVNVFGFIGWIWRDRRLPSGLDRRFAIAWTVPVLALCIFWVIGKPGYVLPLLPLAAIVVGSSYARLSRGVGLGVIALQLFVNAGHFLFLAPQSALLTGGPAIAYHDKPLWQKMFSDLQPLTFPTRTTIATSDNAVSELLQFEKAACPGGGGIIVSDLQPVDWRRVMWYLPEVTAVHAAAAGADYVGRHGVFSPVPDTGIELTSTCPVLWLAPGDGSGNVARPAGAMAVENLGWKTDAGTLHVDAKAIRQ